MAAPTITPASTKRDAVLKNLRHDGKGYAPGSKRNVVALTDAMAAPLLAMGVVKLLEAK